MPYLEFGGRIYIPPEGDEWIRSRSGALIVSQAGTEPHEENWPARAGQHARPKSFADRNIQQTLHLRTHRLRQQALKLFTRGRDQRSPDAARHESRGRLDSRGASDDRGASSQAGGTEIHSLANIFPLLEGEDFDQLVASVKASSGPREPIVIHDGA